jgi:hypothetical protein
VAATSWTTRNSTKFALGLKPADTVDDWWIDTCVKAANRYVDDTRAGTMPDTGWTVDERTSLGATMLASRWYSRRGSGDVSAFAEFGGPPPSIDRDVEMQLQVGRFFGPVVA